MIFSVFPKLHRHLSEDALASWVREVGLDAVNLVIRPGFWCEQATLGADVPRFVEAMRRGGVSVPMATASGYDPAYIAAHPDTLRLLADHGVKAFRMAYFPLSPTPREAIDQARRDLARVADLCRRIGIQAVYHLHHGQLIASPSAARMLCADLPPEAVGVMLDPGNQSHEGWENIHYSVNLLGRHLAAVGVKDSRRTGDGKRAWAPLHEGEHDWPAIGAALRQGGFDGTVVMMPQYLPDQPDRVTAELKREVTAIRRALGDSQ